MNRLSYEVIGDGPPLVMVHGWCCQREHMRGLAECFRKTHRVYLIDLPGHGATPLGNIPPTLETFADEIACFLRNQDLRDVVLIGHSMGGVLSIMVSGRERERVQAVVNLDGACPLGTSAKAAYVALFQRIQEEGFENVFPGFLRETFFLKEELGEEAEQIIEDMTRMPTDLAVSLLRQFPEVDAVAALRASQAPLLYIGGSAPRFEEAEVRRLRADADIARVALGGHFVQTFCQDQIVPLIERFLAWRLRGI
jgi:pimeloyl-ACP methyl ester carboxylesterase